MTEPVDPTQAPGDPVPAPVTPAPVPEDLKALLHDGLVAAEDAAAKLKEETASNLKDAEAEVAPPAHAIIDAVVADLRAARDRFLSLFHKGSGA